MIFLPIMQKTIGRKGNQGTYQEASVTVLKRNNTQKYGVYTEEEMYILNLVIN